MNRFGWDCKKAQVNKDKHGITFEEAKTVFNDDEALLIPDPDHSVAEERFVLLGRSSQHNILVVVHCERREVIRLISARKATKRETNQYKGSIYA